MCMCEYFSLLLCRVDHLEKHMDEYFKQARRFLGDDEGQLSQLCLLFVHSFQVILFLRYESIIPFAVTPVVSVQIVHCGI